MTAVRMPTAMKVDTNPMVHPSLSMNHLLYIFPAASCLPLPKRTRGAARLQGGYNSVFSKCINAFTIVSADSVGMRRAVAERFNNIMGITISFLMEYAPADISGRCLDSALPDPEGTAARVFCHRSTPGTASKEKCPALSQVERWSASPAALSYKAQPPIPHLLY
jgi:hypothetical protein